MNDSDESDDDFFDATERQDDTQQRSIEQRVDRLEKQMEALSGQLSTNWEMSASHSRRVRDQSPMKKSQTLQTDESV